MGALCVSFDPTKNDFMVGEQTLREYYIQCRKRSGLTIEAVEKRAGINHPSLWSLEKADRKGWQSNSVRSILIGLEALEYEIRLAEV